MIVTCQECQTQFQLDDAKVPETGIRVRCSRCKCAFFVESPHTPAPDHGENLAREALGADSAAAAESSFDSSTPEEESDWEFNEEVDPVVGSDPPVDDLSAARSAVDDLLAGVSESPVDPVVEEPDASESSDSGFDLVSDEFGAEESGLDTDEPMFGDLADGDFDAPMASEPEQDPNAETVDHGVLSESVVDSEFDSDFELDTDPIGDGIEESLAATPEPEPVPTVAEEPAEAFGDVSEELGTPEDWDFFEDADPEPSAAFAPAPALEAQDSSESVASLDREEVAPFAASEPVAEPEAEASAGDAWFTRLRGVLGWVFVAGMCLYAGTVVFLPGALAPVSGSGPIRVAGFEAIRLEGHWIENAVVGPIFVVSGALHDIGGAAHPPGSVLRVRLLDARSGTVVSESAAVGPPIPTVRLRESNPRDLRAVQEQGAAAILDRPVSRRKRRPFMAVLTDVPSSAVAFDLQLATATATAPDPVGAFDAEQELDGGAAEAFAGEGMTAEPRARATAAAAVSEER